MEIPIKITIIGTGYVGLVSGCLRNCRPDTPEYAPGLKEIIERKKHYKRIEFTIDVKYAVSHSEVIFRTIRTLEKEDGSVDMKYVFEMAKDIAFHMNDYKVVVDTSTVPIGTGKKVKEIIQNILKDRK